MVARKDNHLLCPQWEPSPPMAACPGGSTAVQGHLSPGLESLCSRVPVQHQPVFSMWILELASPARMEKQGGPGHQLVWLVTPSPRDLCKN